MHKGSRSLKRVPSSDHLFTRALPYTAVFIPEFWGKELTTLHVMTAGCLFSKTGVLTFVNLG